MRSPILAMLLLPLAGCAVPATVVEVVTSTDAPTDRAMILSAEVRRENGPMLRRALLHLERLDGALPVSFGIVPAKQLPDARVTVRLEAYFPPRGGQPERTISRVAEFGFAGGMHTRLPLFLAWRCGNASTGCSPGGSLPCTVARRCEERGLTCDESGECASPVETPAAAEEDAGLSSLFDVSTSEAAVPDSATDAEPSDASMDAVMDVATDAAVDVTADASMDAPRDTVTDAPRTDVQSTDTRVCTPNARRCSGAQLYVCNAAGTAETLQATCGSNALCTSGTGTSCAMPVCASGQRRCDGAHYQQCNGDLAGWTTVQTCASSSQCTTSGCFSSTGACVPGHRQCIVCPGSPADDCVEQCAPSGTGWYIAENCGFAQPPSCDPISSTDARCNR